MNKKLLFRLFALVAAMMCALGMQAIEAYANYTPSNTTLTFYYDNYRSSRPGTTYDLNTGSNDPGWLVDPEDGTSPVTKVVFDISFAGARPTTTYCWFYDMENLQSITGMSYLNTSEVTNMTWMFGNCTELTSLDLTHFNTTKVTDMSAMFYSCESLSSLDLSSFSTSQVTRMPSMFYRCTNLRTVYVGNGWSTAAVTYSANMFSGCTRLVGGQGTTWSSSNPTDKTYAHIDGGTSNPGYFTRDPNAPEAYACYTSSNTTLTFYYDSQRSSRPGTTYDLNTGYNYPDWIADGTNYSVTKVVFDPSFAGARPTTTYCWFYEMDIQTITGMSYLNTSEVTNMSAMFGYCWSLTSLDLSGFNTSQVTDMSNMFYYCSNLRTIYVGNGWSTAAVTSSYSMFYECTSLVGGQGTTYDENHVNKTYAHIDGGTSNPGYFTAEGDEPWEAYACYTPSNTTLTFYFDNQRSSRPGTTYDLNTWEDPDWLVEPTEESSPVTKVVFDPSFADARPTTTYCWFYGMVNLQSITGMSYLNTSKVTNMDFMFTYCANLTSLDLSSFNTSQVLSMNGMFCYCCSLTSLDLSSFNTSQVTNMNSMFYYCIYLMNLDLSSFNTSQVTNMAWMFGDCSCLTSLDLSSFNTSKVTNMADMFYNSYNLRTVYVGNGWSTAVVTTSDDMFYECTSLVGGQGTTYNASNPKDKTYAHIDGGTSNPGYFTERQVEAYACYTPSNTTLTFYYDNQRSSRSGTTYDLNTGTYVTGWETDGTNANVTKVVFDPSFADARPTTTYDWFYEMANLQSITGMSYLNTSEVTHMGWMFGNCTKLTSLDVSHFNTSQVVSMKGMFQQCSSLTSLDLSSFNTSKVTIMHSMFNKCSNLRTVYVGNGWTTAAVTSSNNMFSDCTRLVGGQGTTYNSNHVNKTYAHIDGGPSNPGYFTDKNAPVAYACYTPSNTTLTFYYDSQRSSRTGTTYDLNTGTNITGWDTDGTNASVTKVVFDPSFAGARPTSTCGWFHYMPNLESITGMEYLNTSEVTHMGWMFMECYKLTSLDLSHFNTSKVTRMTQMFTYCTGLTSLDLSHFNTSKVTYMNWMFEGSTNLRTIYVGDGWSTAAVTESSDMFTNCYNLVGGKGTTYDANHIDKAYAHIDGGTSNPGYFTEKVDFVRGDVNGDTKVNMDDLTALINYLLTHDATGIDMEGANVNQSGGIGMDDLTCLINYLLTKTW